MPIAEVPGGECPPDSVAGDSLSDNPVARYVVFIIVAGKFESADLPEDGKDGCGQQKADDCIANQRALGPHSCMSINGRGWFDLVKSARSIWRRGGDSNPRNSVTRSTV